MSLGTSYFGIAVHDGKIGILDIGSNSVRLVVYDGMKRAPMPVFNEKVLCELGKNLARTGKLNPEGVVEAHTAIARFLAMARVMDVVELYILATAAVRDAEDGKRFVKVIEREHNVNVQIISGKEEAQLAAKGVIASLHNTNGLVGDLGGGSFELVRLAGDNRISDQTSLKLGALRLMDESKGNIIKAAEIVKKELSTLSWLKQGGMKNFYAVGGSFRALSHIHILQTGYPLEVLHAYECKAAELKPFLREIAKMPVEEVGLLPGSSKKRAPQLAYAATILAELLDYAKIENVVFSTAGIREGFLFDQLSPYLKQEDGLIACCVDLASQNGRLENYPRELFHWMNPLFVGETEEARRLRFACCLLSEFAWRIHPQYRAEWQFTRMIQSSFIGLNHFERVSLALALYHRHKLKTELKNAKVTKLLTKQDQLRCQMVGQIMSAGFALSGGMSGVLAKLPLEVDGVNLRVVPTGPDVSDLITDVIQKRLEAVSETLTALSSRPK